MGPGDFDNFLTWLDPNREQAIKAYEVIQAKLARYFLCRGWALDADRLTDETIDRVVKKMRKLADSYVGERLPYFLAVARNIHKEQLKEEERRRKMVALLPTPFSDSTDEKERRDRCLHRCMEKQTSGNRTLIQRYYVGEKHEKIVARKKLADELGIVPNALRIRAHRIRTDLRRCVETCVDEVNFDQENVAEENTGRENVTKPNGDETD